MTDDEAVPSFDDPAKEAGYWRVKAQDLQDMLKETESSLKDFVESSQELEKEMERELALSSKELETAKTRNEKLSQDKDEWKVKYQNSLMEHNKTLAEMSRELSQLRESHNIYKNKLRDMELDNDELENAERMVRSSLNDIESRYNQQMEKATLMEGELLDKGRLEEDNQRLRDEIRELSEEVAVLRERDLALSSRMQTPADGGELTLGELGGGSSRPESSASSSHWDRDTQRQNLVRSPTKPRPSQAASVSRSQMLPRKSVSTSHSRQDSRDVLRPSSGANVPMSDSPTLRSRRAELAGSTRQSSSRTPRTVRSGGPVGGNASGQMKNLLANMTALQVRIREATAAPAHSPGNTFDPDRSAIPRPSSRLGTSVSARGGFESPLAASTATARPRPSFDGRSSIPVASGALNRSIRRPSSRLSMGPNGSTTKAHGGGSPPDADTYNHPARSMTPTMYTARAKAHPSALSATGLSRGSEVTSPLDFLNTEPTRPGSRSGFTPKDSLMKSRRPSQHHGHHRTSSSATAGADADAMPTASGSSHSSNGTGRPRGSTIGGGSGAASFAPSQRFTPSVSKSGTAAASGASSRSEAPSLSSASASASLAAFRESRINRSAASSSNAASSSSTTSSASSSRTHRPLSGLTGAGGPPPPSWKKRNDPLVHRSAVDGSSSGVTALLNGRRSRSSSVGSATSECF